MLNYSVATPVIPSRITCKWWNGRFFCDCHQWHHLFVQHIRPTHLPADTWPKMTLIAGCIFIRMLHNCIPTACLQKLWGIHVSESSLPLIKRPITSGLIRLSNYQMHILGITLFDQLIIHNTHHSTNYKVRWCNRHSCSSIPMNIGIDSLLGISNTFSLPSIREGLMTSGLTTDFLESPAHSQTVRHLSLS